MSTLSIEVQGAEEVAAVLERAKEAISKERMTDILFGGAEEIRKAVRPQIPVGPTGKLHDAIRSVKMTPSENWPAVALVAMNFKKAPHANLVEKGHRTVQGGRLKVSERQRRKGAHAGMITGRVPPHPYFYDNVKTAAPLARAYVIESIEYLLEDIDR